VPIDTLDDHSKDASIAEALVDRGLTIATCESCTGGLVVARLTDRSGSSAYVLGGLVTYSNEAKTALANVPAELIAEHGAVSAEVAEAMARGARAALGSDIAVSTTGVAGPTGGTATKPVGLVHLCVAGPGDAVVHAAVNLPGDRAAVRTGAVDVAFGLIARALESTR
jgi:nicotinamide-nucleotide amidase